MAWNGVIFGGWCKPSPRRLPASPRTASIICNGRPMAAGWRPRARTRWSGFTTWRPAALEQALETGQKEVNGVSFSPDGLRLASAGDDGTIRVWNLAGGKETLRIAAHPKLAFQALFHAGGTMLISCGNDPTIRIWDARTGKEQASLRGHQNGVETIALSPDGLRLASGGADATTRIWDLAQRRELHTLAADAPWTSSAPSPSHRMVSGWRPLIWQACFIFGTRRPASSWRKHASWIDLILSPCRRMVAIWRRATPRAWCASWTWQRQIQPGRGQAIARPTAGVEGPAAVARARESGVRRPLHRRGTVDHGGRGWADTDVGRGRCIGAAHGQERPRRSSPADVCVGPPRFRTRSRHGCVRLGPGGNQLAPDHDNAAIGRTFDDRRQDG